MLDTPTQNRKRWTEQDDRLLKHCIARNASLSEMANIFGRTEKAIEMRIYKMNNPEKFISVKRRKKTQRAAQRPVEKVQQPSTVKDEKQTLPLMYFVTGLVTGATVIGGLSFIQ
mgnify:CR=1 FL=1